MKTRLLGKVKRPTNPKSSDEKKISAADTGINLNALPDDTLLSINEYLLDRETSVLMENKALHTLFQPKFGEKTAKDAAECAINPTKENVAKLQALLKACPKLLLHPVTVKNRHGMAIKGTVYQIALHECDNELIHNVITEGFKKLKDGMNIMEAQRKAWLPEDKEKNWKESEEKLCKTAFDAIDNIFVEFKNATNLDDITELQVSPYTITINKDEVKHALAAFREAIDNLYKPQVKVIESGRDPSIRLLQRVIDRFNDNYDSFGGYDTPRNNSVMRSLYGYCQRFSPINFMQAFAQGIYYIVENKEKLNRSLAYLHWSGHFILPLDLEPDLRLGFDYFAGVAGAGTRGFGMGIGVVVQHFFSIKNSSSFTVMPQQPAQDSPLELLEQVSSRANCAIL